MSTTPIHDSVRRWEVAAYVRDLFAPLRAYVGMEPPRPNPLAVGRFCGCSCRLEDKRACPMCDGAGVGA